MRVYLAGTISTDPRTYSWRAALAERIRLAGHIPLNPMRYQNPDTFTREGLGDTSTPSSFFWKTDKGDLARADVFVGVYWQGKLTDTNPLGYRRQSIGTWIELGLALTWSLPIIIVTDDMDVREHPAIQQEAAIVVESIEEAWKWLDKILISGDC